MAHHGLLACGSALHTGAARHAGGSLRAVCFGLGLRGPRVCVRSPFSSQGAPVCGSSVAGPQEQRPRQAPVLPLLAISLPSRAEPLSLQDCLVVHQLLPVCRALIRVRCLYCGYRLSVSGFFITLMSRRLNFECICFICDANLKEGPLIPRSGGHSPLSVSSGFEVSLFLLKSLPTGSVRGEVGKFPLSTQVLCFDDVSYVS